MFISPMLLETAPGPFSNSDFIFEPKVDGHRLIYSQRSDKVRLYTRHNNDCTQQYPELLLPFDSDIILDGEVACTDPLTGLNDFEAVMSRFSTRQHSKVQQLIKTLPATFAIFDILQYKGQDLRKLPSWNAKQFSEASHFPPETLGLYPTLKVLERNYTLR